MKTIGILGGMGPVSTAKLYQNILETCQKKYKAVQDSDYPPIFIYSMALKGSDETGIPPHSEKVGSIVLKQFIEGARKLERAGSDFIIIPCNTVEEFHQFIKKSVKIPVLNIIEECVKEAKTRGLKKVGLLASETTYRNKMYENHLTRKGIVCIDPSRKEQEAISRVILHAMSGRGTPKDRETLNSIIRHLHKRSAEGVILGCTELPLVINQKQSSIRLLDSLQILAERAVALARK